MTNAKKFHIRQIAPDLPLTWATTEWFIWDQELNDILKQDVDGKLFGAAYDAVDWEKYYDRLKGTPFYEWAVTGGGILTFGGSAHIESNSFFSTIGMLSTVEEDYLKEHLEFNQVLHDLHVEAATEMIDYLLEHGPKIIEGSAVEPDSPPPVQPDERTPQYIFSLNPYRFINLTHCPECKHPLESRKLPLLITVKPSYLPMFMITCHYCPPCDWLILDQHTLEGLLAAMFMEEDPTAIGNDYTVFGTVDQEAWERGAAGEIDMDRLQPYIHKFKEVRPFKLQRKGLDLTGSSASKKRRPAKSKRLSRHRRKKGKRR